jgi:hypothetical protein
MWPLILREVHKLQVFENKVLKKTSAAVRKHSEVDDITGHLVEWI